MAKTALIPDHHLADLLERKTFYDQVLYCRSLEGKLSGVYAQGLPRQFPDGFFEGHVLEQVGSVVGELFHEVKEGRARRCVILEVPPFAGRTLAVYISSFLKAYSQGQNAIIVCPSILKRRIAAKSLENEIQERIYDRFPSILEFDENTPFGTQNAGVPQILLCDLPTLHRRVLADVSYPAFWESIGLITFEDIDKYQGVSGSNAAYVFRRLLARVYKYGASPDLFCTSIPTQNRTVFVRSLLGPLDDHEFVVVGTDQQNKPSTSLIRWYLPVRKISVAREGRVHVESTREDYWEELSTLLAQLITPSEKSQDAAFGTIVAVWWDESPLSDDDVADIKARFAERVRSYNRLFIASSLDELRFRMVTAHPPTDWNKLSSLLIIGSRRPAAVYASHLKHIGATPHNVIIFGPQSPSCQFEAYNILEQATFPTLDLLRQESRLDLDDTEMIENHARFLREEYPDIDEGTLQKFFPHQFTDHFLSAAKAPTGRYLFLNNGIRFLPRAPRSEQQLLESAVQRPFSVILADPTTHQETPLDVVEQGFVRAYCYPNAKLVLRASRYLVLDLDMPAQRVKVRTLADRSLATFKLSSYRIGDVDGSPTETHVEFNGSLIVRRRRAAVSEDIYGVKTTTDYQRYELLPYEQGAIRTFEDTFLDLVQLEFPSTTIDNCFSHEAHTGEEAESHPAEQQPEAEQHSPKIADTSFLNLFHTLAHLLYESVRIDRSVCVEEVKIQLQEPTEENRSYSIFFIDLTGKNFLFLEAFAQGSVRQLFERAETMLLRCPCPEGSRACVEIDYCNRQDCIGSAALDKLAALRFVGTLLERTSEALALRERWKRIPGEVHPDETGIGHSHVARKNELEELARKVWSEKGLLHLDTEYASRFFSRAELASTESLLGFCDKRNRQIAYAPGLPEIILYATIFHERFHNYQYTFEGGKRNLNPELERFNWDKIDDPRNIPYMGRMVAEGSAVWFSMRMLEFFSALDYINAFVENSRMVESLAGLHLMLALEQEQGYSGALKSLRDGFEVGDYEVTFRTVVEEELNDHLMQRLPSGQEGHWLRCLHQKQQLHEAHRVSFYLRERRVPSSILEGLEQLFSQMGTTLAHVSREQVIAYALQSPEQYVDNPHVRGVFANIGLLGRREEVLCETCPSACRLFTACMINGGRNNMRAILQSAFPPPEPRENPRTGILHRILRWFRRRRDV